MSSKWNTWQYHALILAGKYNMILPAHLGSTLDSREVERLLSAYGFGLGDQPHQLCRTPHDYALQTIVVFNAS